MGFLVMKDTITFLRLILFLMHLCYCSSSQSTSENCNVKNVENNLKGDLVFAHVMFRHGDRTPLDPYPNDPWRNRSYWPTGWGQLTNTGKREHFELGQWLRKRYNSLLSQTYSNEEIYIQSTDVDRTLMSALSNLAGFYPPQNNDVWDANINWQPIPVHTIPEKLDHILAGKKNCEAYSHALSALYNSPEFQNIKNQYKYLFDYLTEHTGRKIKTFEDISRINNTFFIEELYNRTLPSWTKKVYPSDYMSFISGFSFAISTYTTKLARLKTGSLIKEILDRSKNKAQGVLSPNRFMWIYSGHDVTIASVLNTLKIFEYHSPPYCACIMFELRIGDNNQPFLSIFYKNTTEEPKLMKIPGCGVACPLEKMYSLYKDIIPVDWDAECNAFTITGANSTEVESVLEICILIAVGLLLSYFLAVFYRRKPYKAYLVA